MLRMKKARLIDDEKYKRFVEVAPVGIYEMKFDPPRFVWFNEEVCRSLGYTKEELMKMNPFDITDEAGKRLFRERFKRQLAGEKVAPSSDYKVTTKDGRELWVTMHSLFTYDNGVVDGAIIITEDITARKQAEERLQESEERFRLVAEAAKVHVYELNLEINEVTFSRGLEKLLGYKTEEVSLSHEWWMNKIHPDDRDSFEDNLNKAIESALDTMLEYRIRCKDGGYIVIHDTVKMVKDDSGKVVRIVGGVRDFTKRKKAEKALEEAQIDLNRAQAVAKTGSWRLDIQRNVLRWSDETYRMFGIPKGTPLTYETFLGTVHPEDRIEVDKRWQAALSGEPYDIEHRIIVAGEIKWVREKAELEFDKDCRVQGGFGTVQDITEFVKLRETLKASHAKLEEYANQMERLAEERAEKLKDAERLAAIGATAGMVGHDLRNPLQAIINELYLAKMELTERYEGHETTMMLASLKHIADEVNYMDKIVQDLQDYAKSHDVTLEKVDLEKIFQKLLMETDFPENINAKYRVAENARKIVADPALVERIVTNLTNNAVQAMPEGGKLEISAYRDGNEFIIEVQDSGVGIPDEVKPNLFKPLFSTKAKGQGFGLAVVKRMTEALGGTVIYESKKGKGTKFIVRLPATKK